MKGRILVVDDLPDVRSTICGVLEDAGFATRPANSREQALAILQEERFHAAVLDVRLDDSDEDNQEGMQLLQDIRQYDSSMAVIILTGYATVNIVRAALQPVKGIQPAYAFLLKTEIERLPEKVYSAFRESLRLNLNLEINDPEGCIDQLAKNIHFGPGTRPERAEVAEQMREVFGKLFFECESIRVGLLQQGFSGSAVFQVRPCYQGRGEGENVVVKVGNKRQISDEIEHYDQYVKGMIGGHRIPEAIQSAHARQVSGILYSFAGLGGDPRNLAEFYRSAGAETVQKVLDNLYLETLFPQRRKTGRLETGSDLCEFYQRYLHLDDEKFKKVAERTTDGKHAFRRGPEGELLSSSGPMLDPIEYARRADFHANGYFTLIHGDLNGQNVLIDRHENTWLIDFATTTDDGHILQDYATVENNIRLRLSDSDDLELLFKWTRASFPADLAEPCVPRDIEADACLSKAHHAILHLRELARQTPHYSNRAYLIALFFNALRLTTFNDVPVPIRDHAFYCASIIAERLSKGASHA